MSLNRFSACTLKFSEYLRPVLDMPPRAAAATRSAAEAATEAATAATAATAAWPPPAGAAQSTAEAAWPTAARTA